MEIESICKKVVVPIGQGTLDFNGIEEKLAQEDVDEFIEKIKGEDLFE